MALIKCPECGKEVSDRAPACVHCGVPLSPVDNSTHAVNKIMKKCVHCNMEIPNEAHFCSHCGQKFEKKVMPSIQTPSKKLTKKQIVCGVVALSVVVILLSVLVIALRPKEHVYRNIDFGMTASQVKTIETAKLAKEFSNGDLCYFIRDNQEMTVEYSFDADGKLNLIEAYYMGDKYTKGDFFDKTKRELDIKYGHGKEYQKKNVSTYGSVWYYDGYEWDCDGYTVQFIYWEDGFLKLTYRLDD